MPIYQDCYIDIVEVSKIVCHKNQTKVKKMFIYFRRINSLVVKDGFFY